jgi:hypothetical protein
MPARDMVAVTGGLIFGFLWLAFPCFVPPVFMIAFIAGSFILIVKSCCQRNVLLGMRVTTACCGIVIFIIVTAAWGFDIAAFTRLDDAVCGSMTIMLWSLFIMMVTVVTIAQCFVLAARDDLDSLPDRIDTCDATDGTTGATGATDATDGTTGATGATDATDNTDAPTVYDHADDIIAANAEAGDVVGVGYQSFSPIHHNYPHGLPRLNEAPREDEFQTSDPNVQHAVDV